MTDLENEMTELLYEIFDFFRTRLVSPGDYARIAGKVRTLLHKIEEQGGGREKG